MFVYFTDGTCINDSEIYGVKAKQEQKQICSRSYDQTNTYSIYNAGCTI